MDFATTAQRPDHAYQGTSYRHLYLYVRPGQYGQGGRLPAYGARSAQAPHSFSPSTSFPTIDDGPQTVEQTIHQGYFAPPAWPAETALLHDRRHTSWLALDDVLGQIQMRQRIYEENMTEIEWAKCYAFNEMARGGWPPSPEQYGLWERRVQDLCAEQRAERVSAWRDMWRLRQVLPESAQQYLSALRKSEIVEAPLGDGP